MHAGDHNTTRRNGASRSILALAAIALALLLPSTATATAPTVETRPAENVTSTEATLRGAVNPQDQPTTWHFEYATAREFNAGTYPHSTQPRPLTIGAFGASVPSLFVTSGVSERVTGLSPNTTYHFRLVATNADGTTHGADLTFETLKKNQA